MSESFLSAGSLADWVEGLRATHRVIAPVRRGEVVVFREIAEAGEIAWDAGRADFSAKEFFFPASEAIVTWQPTEEGVRTETPLPGRPQVLLGARPCDAHALEVMDRLLLDDPVDLYYAERRARTTLVGLACTDGPWEGCFCTTVGGGPAERRHLDILLVAVDGGFAVDVASEKGHALTASARLEALDGRTPKRAPVVAALEMAAGDAWRRLFDDPCWGELAERCLGCRTCTYDCPVCYCFDVRDRRRADGRVERLRCWDSCQGALCFAIAGGHNPRPTQKERLRQRYMHKFLYYPAREGGAALCVGCGRCVVQCPANIDVREVLAHVAEAVR
jgi:NAD-dependent dihydropyrimidine dehydrogenase PreA subunit